MKAMRFILALFLIFHLGSASPSLADESSKTEAFKSLAVNRSLLARFETQYQNLKEKGGRAQSFQTKKELENLRYKIKALTEDSKRLTAGEFMSDLLAKETAKRAFPAPLGAAAAPKKPEIGEKTKALHEKALDLVAQDKLGEAAKLYEEIVMLDPGDDQAYLIMGHSYLLSGQYEKAESAFHNAARIDPDNVNEIIPFYQNIILKAPDDDAAQSHLGYAYLILGDFEKAKDAFRDALSINPENTEAGQGLQIAENR